MAKRIIKETLKNGTTQYRVESNRVLWIIPVPWHTVQWFEYVEWDTCIPTQEIFRDLKDAMKFCGFDDENKVITREIICPKQETKEEFDYKSLDYIPFNRIIEENFWDLACTTEKPFNNLNKLNNNE